MPPNVREHYPFAETFQRKLATYVLTEGFPLLEHGVVSPEYFESPYIQTIVARAKTYIQTMKSGITLRILHDLLEREVAPDEWKFYLETLKALSRPIADSDKVYVVSEATTFAKNQNYKHVLRRAVMLLQEGKIRDLDSLLERATHFGSQALSGKGSLYFQEVKQRLQRRDSPPDTLKSFIRGLDESLQDGGYGRKELHVFAALPSAGKSMALDYMAKVSVIQGKKVVLYTLEMSEMMVATRLDASFSGVSIKELRSRRQEVEEAITKRGKRYGESLLIKEFPSGVCQVGDLKAHLHQLRMQSFVPDVVIVDYVNLLGTGNKGQRHRDLGQVYVDLRGLAQQMNAWVFTAAQSNRGGYDANLLTMKNLAESFEGAMHADTVVTLNRTDEEAQREYMRLYLAKDRNGVDRRLIPIYTNYAKGSFYRRVKREEAESQ